MSLNESDHANMVIFWPSRAFQIHVCEQLTAASTRLSSTV